MNEFLSQTYHRLIAELETTYQRFLYKKINLNNRLTGLIGPRGVGKTTLLLQIIKNELYDTGEAFYFSADNTVFNEISILEYVDDLYQNHGIRYFFIDEIHKYANWSQELKNIYDSFSKAHVFFSGSSSIDLVKGSHDLSRRAQMHHMPGLSFREYLNIKMHREFEVISWDQLMSDHIQLASQLSSIASIASHFNAYLELGYYPIIFENQDDLYQTLLTVIDKTIYEDIANFYHLKTNNLHHFKRILNFLSSIPPARIKVGSIAKHLQIDNKTAENYLSILEQTGLAQPLYPNAHGNQLLTKANKIYIDNTTLLTAMNHYLSNDVDVGTLREIAFLQFISGAKIPIFHADKGDFMVEGFEVEVGGKNKTWQQLKAVSDKKILVKDRISVGSKGVIPLYLFGFLY